MKANIILRTTPLIWISVFIAASSVRAEEVKSELIGRSDKAQVLNISPDGKWLLSWDGVEENTPETNASERLIWDLTTKKSRELRYWSKQVEIYDHPCGWTPDNRIWQIDGIGHPTGDSPSPYTPSVYIQSPDGKNRVVCHDKTSKFWYDDNSYLDEHQDLKFSADGKVLFLLTKSFYRIFNTKNGKMLFKRRLATRERQEAYLSCDGAKIFAIEGEYSIEGNKANVKWWLSNAKSGRLIKRLKPPSNAQGFGLSDANLVMYQQGETIFHADPQTLKTVWSSLPLKAPDFLNSPVIFTIQDARNGNTRHFEVSTDNWRTLKRVTISPDRKTFYALDLNQQIFRFPTLELSKTDKKISP